MSIIDFFGKKIKPLKLRGTGMLHPEATSVIDEYVSCIQQLDVNLWFYRKGNTVIAFDAGYDHCLNVEREFQRIRIDPNSIQAVFLTHADMDHAGGLSDGAQPLYPQAKIYLHEKEIDLWRGKTKRFAFGPIAFRNPVSRQSGFCELSDGAEIFIDEVKVEVIHTPGHTPGHCCYLVDEKVLFSGDCMAINEEGGYCFFDFFNMDTKKNLDSLQKLKTRFSAKPPSMICTGHSGYSTDSANFFRHVDRIALGTKAKPFDKKAPFDVFASVLKRRDL